MAIENQSSTGATQNATQADQPQATDGEQSGGDGQLEKGTYEILRNRLHTHANSLKQRLAQLNTLRSEVFGSIPTELVSTQRITTEHNCVARDIASFGDSLLFGYNVHMGLKSETHLSDVFSIFLRDGDNLTRQPLTAIENKSFEGDFKELYKYYKGTRFSKFHVIGPHLYFVFQIGEDLKNVKSFKWLIEGDQLRYIDNRSDHEVKFPVQHEFKWTRTHRDLHRAGAHPHISIDDRVFVETVGGDLTIKIEDNTNDGAGIYSEPVSDADQTLDDAEIFYAILGNLILLRIKPFREDTYRYLVFNEKTSQAMRIDAIRDACVSLPEDHGLIFSNGYYLQTGLYKTFETGLTQLVFEKQLPSSNGEDYLYVFYNRKSGTYLLLSYNMISQTVATPTPCNGYSFFDDGKMLVFRSDANPQKHHALQIWQTPFVKEDLTTNGQTAGQTDSILYKIGNRDVVRAMSECNEILSLIDKDDSYSNLYVDLVKKTTDTMDTYFWLNKPETFHLDQTLAEIREVASTAIDEFEKVTRTRRETNSQLALIAKKAERTVAQTYKRRFQSIDDYVTVLASLRTLRGEVVSLQDLKYIDTAAVQKLEEQVKENTDKLSQRSVEFLLKEDSLAPYQSRVREQLATIEQLTKVTQAKTLHEDIDKTGKDLEMLIEIVSNLKINDATQRTRIIDNISSIYSQLNQTRAKLKGATKQLLGTEGKAEFHSQLKLLGQAVVNYLDVCDTPQRCDEYLTKMMVQLEELEGRFAEFDEFIVELAEKRDEIYAAFESKKLQLQEARNRRTIALLNAADRILGGVRSRVGQLKSIDQIHSYFAGDLMVEKIRDIVKELEKLEDSVKVDDIQSRLKTIREDAVRQLKDRQDLFVDGSNIIQLGKHKFTTNVQNLDLTTVFKDDQLYFHLTGTNYMQPVLESELHRDDETWSQEVISENRKVYRSEYLAKLIYDWISSEDSNLAHWFAMTEAEMNAAIQSFMAPRYQESYIKGVHDHDAAKILRVVLDKHQSLGVLRNPPQVRNLAMLFWLQEEWKLLDKKQVGFQLDGIKIVRQLFPSSQRNLALQGRLEQSISHFAEVSQLYNTSYATPAAIFLYDQMTTKGQFDFSADADHLLQGFKAYLQQKDGNERFLETVNSINHSTDRLEVVNQWLSAYLSQDSTLKKRILSHYVATDFIADATAQLESVTHPHDGVAEATEASVATQTDSENADQNDNSQTDASVNDESELTDGLLHWTIQEAALVFLLGDQTHSPHACQPIQIIDRLLGNHRLIENSRYRFDFYDFCDRLLIFQHQTVPKYQTYVAQKKSLLDRKRKELKLEQFQPKVLTSFVRNRLINEIYLPLIGNNLAKQMGAVGDQKRTDLMGLLLLVSPPGYGKTTLMEYLANRLGITFMKINGPAIGHHVTSLDPMEAPNASARQEVEKLNLALEMGDNVMIYLDDIQHCNPEFLQKFISLCDGQRKIEGVFAGETRTYDLRGKKVCVVMAGNPYTESGEKFQIPDMLSNRADTYNLGDVIGGSADAFEMSYLENCLTSNATLSLLQSRSQKDVYAIIEMATSEKGTNVSLEGSYSTGQINEMVDVMRKLIFVRNVLLKVNALYIESAAQADEYRTEPSFKLQGSYRDMNKIAERIVPVMNQKELEELIASHFENQAQTLTSAAEANLLKFKELINRMTAQQQQRWNDIKHAYKRNLVLGAAGQSDDKASQIIAQLSLFSEGLYEIRSALAQGASQLIESANDPQRFAMQDLTIQQIGGAVQQLVQFNQALDEIKDVLNRQAEATAQEAAKPTKIHVSNKVPATFMKVITGQFQVLQTWMEPILAIAENLEGGKQLKRAAKATQAHYQKIMDATDKDLTEDED